MHWILALSSTEPSPNLQWKYLWLRRCSCPATSMTHASFDGSDQNGCLKIGLPKLDSITLMGWPGGNTLLTESSSIGLDSGDSKEMHFKVSLVHLTNSIRCAFLTLICCCVLLSIEGNTRYPIESFPLQWDTDRRQPLSSTHLSHPYACPCLLRTRELIFGTRSLYRWMRREVVQHKWRE